MNLTWTSAGIWLLHTPVVFPLEMQNLGVPAFDQQFDVAGAVVPPVPASPTAAPPPTKWIDWPETIIAGLVGAFLVGAGWTLGRWLLGWMVLGRLVGRA